MVGGEVQVGVVEKMVVSLWLRAKAPGSMIQLIDQGCLEGLRTRNAAGVDVRREGLIDRWSKALCWWGSREVLRIAVRVGASEACIVIRILERRVGRESHGGVQAEPRWIEILLRVG